METFKIKALDDWQELGEGEVLQFPATESGKVRSVGVEFNGVGEYYVLAEEWDPTAYVVEGEVLEPVAHGRLVGWTAGGLMRCEFTVRKGAVVSVLGGAGPVFYKPDAQGVVLKGTGAPKLTTLAVRRQRNPELERMMAVVKMNEQRRQQTMERELKRLHAALAKVEGRADGGRSSGEGAAAGSRLGSGAEGAPAGGRVRGNDAPGASPRRAEGASAPAGADTGDGGGGGA